MSPHDTHPEPDSHASAPSDATELGTASHSAPLGLAAGQDKILFVDAFSGLAGDMWVGALIDLGIPLAPIQHALAQLPLDGFTTSTRRVSKQSLSATQFVVHVHEPQPSRNYHTIREMLAAAELPEGARQLAQRAFRVLAEAEAQVHGVALDQVHFHEVGAVDSIVDVVATAFCLDHLGARVVGSPVPLSRGFVHTDHGRIPLPAPATLLCLSGVPTEPSGLTQELVTPTGACLLQAAATSFAPWPQLTPERVGLGAGTRDLIDRPNLLRLVLGTTDTAGHDTSLLMLSANVDDMTPEWLAHAMLQALAAGAVDTWVAPIVMKKNRPGFTFHALVRPAQREVVAKTLLNETTTLGLRIDSVHRLVRPRRTVTVSTPYGPIEVKVASGDGYADNAAPEYESCLQAALLHDAPLKQVFAAALHAYLSRTQ